jgi:hypothetical protein
MFCYMPVTRAAIGMLIPRPFGGVSYMQQDMSTTFFSCDTVLNCHVVLFFVATVFLIVLCLIIPLVFNSKLRTDELKREKLERVWCRYLSDGIEHTVELFNPDDSESPLSSRGDLGVRHNLASFERTMDDPSIQRARAHLSKRALKNPEIQSMIRDQCYSELRYSLLSRKYKKEYATVWFIYELYRKLLLNLLYLVNDANVLVFTLVYRVGLEQTHKPDNIDLLDCYSSVKIAAWTSHGSSG